MSSTGRVLVVVAHPDDETIFFGGLVIEQVARGRAVDVVCATGDFGQDRTSRVRASELHRACALLGASPFQLDFADAPEPLPLDALESCLRDHCRLRAYAEVYTHGVFGEYGHRHHADVCRAVHRVFGQQTLSLAGPCPPVVARRLSADALRTKRAIAATAYLSQSFAAAWCSSEEPFARLAPAEVQILAAVLEAGGSWERRRALQASPVAPDLRPLLHACHAQLAPDAPPFREASNLPAPLNKRGHGAWRRTIGGLLDGLPASPLP